MALLDLISNVANKVGYTVDSNQVIGSNDTTTKQLLGWLQTINQEVMESYNWPQLMRAGTITTVEDQADYFLPDDFSYHHYDTFWNQSERWPLYGGLTNQEYADLKGYGVESSAQDSFIITGIVDKKLTISPTPAASGQTLYFLYQANKYVAPRDWSNTTYAAGDYVETGNNFYYVSTGSGTSTTAPTHTSGFELIDGITWTFWDQPYREFLADTDRTILPQRIIEQGLIEAFNDQKGIEYTPKFDEMVMNEYRRTKPAKTLSTSFMGQRFTFGANGRFYFGVAG